VNDSLSIILPVRNSEALLHRQVHQLLELLPDLTGDFEIVIVDDGSADHTADTARELAREYPQLRLICHGEPRGRDVAIKTGLSISQGQTVLVQEDFADISPTHLRRLWSLRDDPQVVMARSQRQAGIFDSALLERLTTWGQALRNLARRASPGGIQMIRRDGAQSLAGANAVIQSGANIAECTTAPKDRP
jgi:cellulose synthase/poly-beta-1,6-N-acetylglucosamine synthase-like glycosyltransferase